MTNTSEANTGIQFPNCHVILYHMFVDDCLIFRKANIKVAWNVKSILDNYCTVSSQLVNFHSMVQLSQGIEIRDKHGILDTLHVPLSNSNDTYLRVCILIAGGP